MLKGAFVLVACLPLLLAAKCGQWQDCNSCASHKEGGLFNFECTWCDSTQSCHDPSPTLDCPKNRQIDLAYDCPVPPENGNEYTDDFARNVMLPIAAAAKGGADTAAQCLQNAVHGAKLKRLIEVHCDNTKKDTCAGFTGVSDYDQAVLLSFRSTSGTTQLIEEGLESLLEKKSFVGGGKVSGYFYNAFYDIWNAGMRQDLLELKAQYPNYKLYVTGHSLGGAMAALGAAVAVKTGIWDGKDVKMVTYGQPRTGDLDFAEAHDQLVKFAYRVVHQNDIVPHLPPKEMLLGNILDSYYHHRYEVWYNNAMGSGTTYQLCDRADSPLCSNSKTDLSVDEHTHYFGIDISDWGMKGCPPANLYKKEDSLRKRFNRHGTNPK